jgi:hypothetical protein
MTDDFLALTLDVWSMPPESARRVGHPAPFPVELPEQLIRLYTYEDDLVLDPFMGSGSSMVAAARLGRRYVGYDLDPEYVEIARQRVREEGSVATSDSDDDPATRAARDGKAAPRLAEELLEEAGFRDIRRDRRVRGTAVSLPLTAVDASGDEWFFDVSGTFTTYRGGLQRMETVWKTLGRAAALKGARDGTPLVLLTTHLPKRSSSGDQALRSAGPGLFFDAVELLSNDDLERLTRYAKGGYTARPEPGFWTEKDLEGLDGPS